MHSYKGYPFKLGIVQFMAYPDENDEREYLEALTKTLEDVDFGAIEVTRVPSGLEEKVRNLLAQAGVDIGFGSQPIILKGGLDIGSHDQEKREKAIEEIKAAVDQAAFLGAKMFGLASGPDPIAGESAGSESRLRKEALARTKESLMEICRYAESKGLRVALEPFDDTLEKKRLIGASKLALEVSQEVAAACSNFGLMVDLSHIPQLGEDPVECVKTLGRHIIHVHVANAVLSDPKDPAYGDKHPRFGVKNSALGVGDIKRFLDALVEVGYLSRDKIPVISFEVKPLPGENPGIVVCGTKRIIQSAIWG